MTEKIEKVFGELFDKGYEVGYKKAKEEFARPHGEWKVIHNALGETKYKCSQCQHYVRSGDDKNFCPNCGADMREGDSDA